MLNKNSDDAKQQHLANLAQNSRFIKEVNDLKVYQYPIITMERSPDLQYFKTIIFVGQIGSGKSTLINFFLNYYLGVKFEDNFRFILVDEDNLEQSKSQAVSQTQDVKTYYISPFADNYGLRIIDTPGFGDSRGIKQDEIIAQKIFDCFKKEVEALTTICFLVQALMPDQLQIKIIF